jgi:hypothetical protein
MHAKLYPNRPLDERLAACKPWSAFPGRSIVVLPVPRETSSTGAKVFDLELLLIQRPDNGNTERDMVIGRIMQPEALDEDSATAIQDLRIDTSRYVLSSDTRAFGLRVRYRGTAPGSSAASETVRLYVHHGSSCARCCRRSSSTARAASGTAPAPAASRSCAPWFRSASRPATAMPTCNSRARSSRATHRCRKTRAVRKRPCPRRFNSVTLRYDGERYRLPKSLQQQTP